MLEAFFLPVEPGQRFCLLTKPARSPRRGVVYLHAFAEEMNKSRRMAALQARRLAGEGCVVMQIDLLGCGDSSGEFADARWDAWKHDAQAAVAWIRQRYAVPITLWGVRLGALLAADAADAGLGVDHLVLWQPVTDGGQFLSQFLRLRLAGEMLARGAATTAVRDLSEELRRGGLLELAGYELHAELAARIGPLKLETLKPAVRRADWMDVVADRTLALRPAARRVLERWASAGIETDAAQAVGEPFWSTVEIAECAELVELTAGAVRRLP